MIIAVATRVILYSPSCVITLHYWGKYRNSISAVSIGDSGKVTPTPQYGVDTI